MKAPIVTSATKTYTWLIWKAIKEIWYQCNICWQHSSHLQIQTNTQRSLTVMLAKSDCQLWNAVNKMPLSREFAPLLQENERQKPWECETKYLIMSSFHVGCFHLIFLMWLGTFFKPSSSLLWPYLCIHCRPCPHCRRWTVQTSADQGLRCAQTVSVTDDTSLQITHVSQCGKTEHIAWFVFALPLFFMDEKSALFAKKCLQHVSL